MTEQKKPRAKRGEGTAKPTPYVVLGLVTPTAGTDLAALYGIDKAETIARLHDGAWLLLGEAEGKTEKQAIDAVVGNAEGTFKAVSARSWKGGETRSQTTVIASKPIEEG